MSVYYFGLDAGSTYYKIAVFDENKNLIYSSYTKLAGLPEETALVLLKKTISDLHPGKRSIYFGITGKLEPETANFKFLKRREILTAEFYREPDCIVKGITGTVRGSSVDTIIDSGSFTTKVLKIKGTKIADYLINDVCSSGAGIFLELVANSLDITLEELSDLALKTSYSVSITSQCSIFAESEVIYLMNEGKSLEMICRGVCESIAGRIFPLVSKIGAAAPVFFTGGVALLKAVRNILSEKLGFNLELPDIDPRFTTAAGAALYIMEKTEGVRF